MAKVTVLIAVYNSEKYLRQCLDSLLSQTMRSFQAVCVDDGSTDCSWEILQAYARRDRRIEIVHLEENCGQAHARNVALRRATGEITCFLDSDDFLAADALQAVVDTFESEPDTDSVLFRVVYCDEESNVTGEYPMSAFYSMSGKEAFRRSLQWKIHGIYAVRTVIHRLYPYDESARTYSDDNITHIHYLQSRHVSTCDGKYYYRQHRDSVSHEISARRFDLLKANAAMKAKLIAMSVSDDIIDDYENLRWLNCIGLYGFLYEHRKQLSPAEKKYGLNEIKAVWQSIETRRLTLRNSLKPGFLPLKCSWRLFCLQGDMRGFLKGV